MLRGVFSGMKKAATILIMITAFCTLYSSKSQCMGKVINYSDRYGQLSVIEIFGGGKNPAGGYFDRKARCICDCGVLCVVPLFNIHKGHTRSCGCLREKTKATIGGLSKHKLAAVRFAMLGRCYDKKNKAYRNYGGRGITVCQEWRDGAVPFIKWGIDNGWKDGLTLDRKEVDGNYDPDNCRFITNLGQQNNRRDTRMYTVDGVTKSISDWARFYDIPYTKLHWQTIKKKGRKDFAYALYNPSRTS